MIAGLASALLVLGWTPMLVRLRAARPARALPVDRALLVATWILCMAITGAAFVAVRPAPVSRREVAGVALFLIAMAVWSWARATMGSQFAQSASAPGALVTGGPFRVVRHPLYAATAAGTLGHVVAAGTRPVALLWAALVVVLVVRAVREEALLRATFGAEWTAYAHRRTGRVPSRRPDRDP